MKRNDPIVTSLEHLATDNINNTHDVAPVKENEEDYRINMLIRNEYSLSQEFAMIRKFLVGEITEEEFKAYSDYVKWCIEKARTLEQ